MKRLAVLFVFVIVMTSIESYSQTTRHTAIEELPNTFTALNTFTSGITVDTMNFSADTATPNIFDNVTIWNDTRTFNGAGGASDDFFLITADNPTGGSITGGTNTLMGSNAGENISSGSNNTGFGGFTLKTLTTGSGNSAFGASALFLNVVGNNNSAFGSSALTSATGNANSAFGYNALEGVTTGTQNTGVGTFAMFDLAGGSNNVALGWEAGYHNISGTGNVFLGTLAGTNETGSNKLYISNSGTATPLIKGDFDVGGGTNGDLTVNGALTINGPGVTVNGNLQSNSFSSGTNCAAVGTAANPSTVACSAAPAGAFSCDVAASGGTCVISTTVVTANSEIFITPAPMESTRLGVTCNATLLSTLPEVTAKATSPAKFTITLPSFATNPLCFDYFVIN